MNKLTPKYVCDIFEEVKEEEVEDSCYSTSSN
jgi:hypothetical protein